MPGTPLLPVSPLSPGSPGGPGGPWQTSKNEYTQGHETAYELLAKAQCIHTMSMFSILFPSLFEM